MLVSVLLIEDDPDYREIVNFALSRPDYSVQFELHWAKTLSEALNFLTSSRVDVVLVDLGLPDSHGPATVETLATMANDIPYLVLSAEDGDSAMWEVMCRGAEDHLVKIDLKPESLRVAIVNAIARHLERVTEDRGLHCLQRDTETTHPPHRRQ